MSWRTNVSFFLSLKKFGVVIHGDQELAYRASLGDASDEHADEWRPGDPPRPVEDGPAVVPGVILAADPVRPYLGIPHELLSGLLNRLYVG